MTGQEYSPVYIAIGASGEAMAWLKKKERESLDWDTVFHLAKISHALKELLNCHPVPDGDETPQRAEFVITCFGIIVSVTSAVVQSVRDDMSNISDTFRQTISFLLNQLDGILATVQDMEEAWEIRQNSELSVRLATALQEVDRSKTDIRDWRASLELVSD